MVPKQKPGRVSGLRTRKSYIVPGCGAQVGVLSDILRLASWACSAELGKGGFIVLYTTLDFSAESTWLVQVHM